MASNRDYDILIYSDDNKNTVSNNRKRFTRIPAPNLTYGIEYLREIFSEQRKIDPDSFAAVKKITLEITFND